MRCVSEEIVSNRTVRGRTQGLTDFSDPIRANGPYTRIRDFPTRKSCAGVPGYILGA